MRIEVWIDLALALGGDDDLHQRRSHAYVRRNEHVSDDRRPRGFSDDLDPQAGHGFDHWVRRKRAENLLHYEQEIFRLAQLVDQGNAKVQIFLDKSQDERLFVFEILIKASNAYARLGADFSRGCRVKSSPQEAEVGGLKDLSLTLRAGRWVGGTSTPV